jgi:hypothetical protein
MRLPHAQARTIVGDCPPEPIGTWSHRIRAELEQ